MSALATTAPPSPPITRSPGTAPAPIPFTRVLQVELRKMFDTRSGFWLLASILITNLLATAGVILFAPDDAQVYDNFAAAIGFPMVVILPIVAILSVTSEWSQRTGLSTFTLVPHRGRVLAAKATGALLVAVVSMALAFGVGALGNLLGSALTGNELVWNIPVLEGLNIVLGNVIGMAIGFMLAVLIRNSAGAVVAYFVYSFVLPTITELLAMSQEWFRDIRGWVDINFAQGPLFETQSAMTGEQWAQLGVTAVVWILLPLVVGLTLVRRSEVS
jgi:ABC-2 type transport system permease protein